MLEHLLKNQNDWLLKYQLALIYKDRNREAECKQLLLSCDDLPSYAPFYATRAVIFAGSDTSQSLRDLQKALSLDKTQWRYYKMLGEYYNEHQQPQKALAVVAPFYKTHPEQYIMGMLYAKTLMLNKKYKEADAVLAKLNIIPFEGATEGKGLYREAKLMMALQEMQKNNYRKALAFISQSRLWPQNLGVGKPYDDEIDSRLEDWMEYACNRQMKKKGNNVLLESILQFTPRIDNTVSNFIPSNALVSAWAIEKKEGRAKAVEWIDQQITLYPHLRKALEWSRYLFENGGIPVSGDTQKDAGMRILEALVATGESGR